MKKLIGIIAVAVLFIASSGQVLNAQSKNTTKGSTNTNEPKTTVNANCEKVIAKYEKFASRYLSVVKTFELNRNNKALIKSVAKLSAKAADWSTRMSTLTQCDDVSYQKRIKAAQAKINEAAKILQKIKS